ncbi:alpha/beta hydrolase-fold protein [Dactylosporangium sp. NPDC049140]|uniref:alpha/beta hydrolase n=1 Tax=Dactylosporangium sp. NPDC049140 TaxID=3155647 RepID=UPI0033D8290F
MTVGAIALLLRVTGTVTDAYPPSFAVWVFAGFTAVAGLPFTMRGVVDGSARWRRAAAIAAVPLTLAGGFMLIDQQYGIWPTVGDVLAHNGVIGTDQATAMLNNPNARPAAATAGVTVALDAPATRSHFHHRPGMVFLPPAYFGPDGAKLPVLVMLVGAPGTPVNWLTSGGGRPADNAIAAAHHGVAPVLVIVDHNGSATGDTECVDGPQGNAETYLTQDVPAFISGTLHIQHDAGRWGIVGFSEGGTCSLDLVLGHPGIYQHLVDLGGDAKPNLGNPQHTLMALYGGSTAAERAHDPSLLLAARRFPGVTAWFGAGADDPAKIVVAQHMTAAATRDGIPAATYVGVGGHNWQFAADAFAHILPRLCTQLGMAEYDPPH